LFSWRRRPFNSCIGRLPSRCSLLAAANPAGCALGTQQALVVKCIVSPFQDAELGSHPVFDVTPPPALFTVFCQQDAKNDHNPALCFAYDALLQASPADTAAVTELSRPAGILVSALMKLNAAFLASSTGWPPIFVARLCLLAGVAASRHAPTLSSKICASSASFFSNSVTSILWRERCSSMSSGRKGAPLAAK